MNTDNAYLLGLIVGGGILSKDGKSMIINLPYKKWGDLTNNIERAGNISKDIVNHVIPLFNTIYKVNAYFEVSNKSEWTIKLSGDLSEIYKMLESIGISPVGELRSHASIKGLIDRLNTIILKRQFVAGMADTIGSLSKSHRRFSDDYQIVSFEFKKFNYLLIFEFCILLKEIECHTDQILWNHPNLHSGVDKYYDTWNKGSKLRVLLDNYITNSSFAFKSKIDSAHDNLELQNSGNKSQPCECRDITVKCTASHIGINDPRLKEFQGLHLIHSKHLCALMGCPYAPKAKLLEHIDHIEDYIIPFTILSKSTVEKIDEYLAKDKLLRERVYSSISFNIDELIEMYKNDSSQLLFGKGSSGYPINVVLEGIGYVIAGNVGELKGRRVKGKLLDLLENNKSEYSNVVIEIPDLMTPLKIKSGDYCALVGAKNPEVYKKVVLVDKENPLKVTIRPITEEDFNV